MNRVQVTPHAVERYIKRCAPKATLAEARAHLEAQAPTAIRLDMRSALGDALYEIADARLVVKYDRTLRCDVVVTVLERPIETDDTGSREQ